MIGARPVRASVAGVAVTLALALSSAGCSPILGLIVRATQSRGGALALGAAVTGTNQGASDDFEPECAGNAADAVYVFVPEQSGVYRAEVNADYDSVLAIYDAERTSLGCNDDADSTTHSVVEHHLVAGQAYSIVVDGYRGATGSFSLVVTATSLDGEAPEPGDYPALGLDARVAASTVGGADTYTAPCGATPGSPDRVWIFTAPEAGSFVFDVDSTFDGVLAVYAPDASAPLGCNDDHGSTRASRVELELTAGQLVYVVVDGYHGATGDFGLIARPAQAAVRGTLSVGTPVVGDTDQGSDTRSGQCESAAGTPDEAWELTVAESGLYRITASGNFAPVVSIEPAEGGEPLACGGPGRYPRRAEVVARLTAGARYRVVVDGHAAERGAYRLTVGPLRSRQLVIAPTWTNGDTRRGHVDAVTPSCGSRPGSPDQGWLFTAPQAGVFRFDVLAQYNAVLMVENEAGIELACNDDHGGETDRSHVEVALVAGQVVRVVVDGHQGANGAYRIQVGPQGTTAPRPPPPLAAATVENITAVEARCASAEALTAGEVRGTVRAADAHVRTTCAGGAGGAEVIYRLEVPVPTQLTVTAESETYPVLELRQGCSAGHAVVACSGPTRGNRRATLAARLEPGTRYHLIVDGRGQGDGDYVLQVGLVPIAPAAGTP